MGDECVALCCNTGTQSREDDCQKMLGLGMGNLQGQGKERHARMLGE